MLRTQSEACVRVVFLLNTERVEGLYSTELYTPAPFEALRGSLPVWGIYHGGSLKICLVSEKK